MTNKSVKKGGSVPQTESHSQVVQDRFTVCFHSARGGMLYYLKVSRRSGRLSTGDRDTTFSVGYRDLSTYCLKTKPKVSVGDPVYPIYNPS